MHFINLKTLSILSPFLLAVMILFAGPIRYRYDAAGNRIQRLIYVYDPVEDEHNALPGRFMENKTKDINDEYDEKDSKEFSNENFKILAYPNPTETFIHFNVLEYPKPYLKLFVTVFDNQGRQQLEINSESRNNQLDVNFLKPGLYYLQVIIENQKVIFPFEKMSN